MKEIQALAGDEKRPVHPYARTFQDLVVYQHAIDLEVRIFRLSCAFPRSEQYSLTDQIRRSSRSIGAQIAEAWGKRRFPNHFSSKLTDADAEQLETQHWIGSALRSSYITQEEAGQLIGQLQEIGRMLNSMILKSERFCQPDSRLAAKMTRELAPDYFTLNPTTDHPSLVTDHRSPITGH